MPLDSLELQKILTKNRKGDEVEANAAHDKLLKHVMDLVELSRKEMSKHYSTWDYHDAIFRSKRKTDKEDEAASIKGQPSKMIVPLSFSKIMTFVSFAVMSVTQNKRFFELQTGMASQTAQLLKEPCEEILHRDVQRNNWNSFLVQYFLDAARFWIGVFEVCYAEERRHIRVERTVQEPGPFGMMSERKTNEFIEVPVFVGNRVYSVSPYRFFPDTRLPLTRYQEGEFCGSEDTFTYASLLSDSEGLFNLRQIPRFSDKELTQRKERSRIDTGDIVPAVRGPSETGAKDSMVKSGSVVVTKMVLDIIPAEYEMEDDGKKLGTEKFPVRYLCWIANDKTIIRFEEAYYLHGKFPYGCGQYLPDQHMIVNEGLSSVCDQITNLITWKLNAHLTSQKNTIDSKFIVDPSGIQMPSLESRSPYILLKKSAGQFGVDRYIKQFQMTDPTANVMKDVADLDGLLEKITGISAQMQGEYSQGRRSATQDRVVAQGASARAKTTVASLWDPLQLLGYEMLVNNRQEMDFETFVRILGPGPFGPNNDVPVEQLFALFKATPEELAASEEFFVFDGTLPSEKAFLAQSLQEVFTTIATNPLIMQVMGYGPAELRKIFNEIYELRGVTPPSLPAGAPMPVALPSPTVPGAPQIGGPAAVAS